MSSRTPIPGRAAALSWACPARSGLLIVWLALWRSQARDTAGPYSLKAGFGARLGLSLIVVATLHTGFHFSWNVHTLAYGLMMLVIASGAVGVWAALPRKLSDNREITRKQMLAQIRA